MTLAARLPNSPIPKHARLSRKDATFYVHHMIFNHLNLRTIQIMAINELLPLPAILQQTPPSYRVLDAHTASRAAKPTSARHIGTPWPSHYLRTCAVQYPQSPPIAISTLLHFSIPTRGTPWYTSLRREKTRSNLFAQPSNWWRRNMGPHLTF